MADSEVVAAARVSAGQRPHDRHFPSIWMFIAADVMSFGVFFAVFMSERAAKTDLFRQSAAMLDVGLGLANTLILITSSWMVALAVAASRRDDMRAVRRFLALGLGIGFCFAVFKLFEYGEKINHGITMLTNDFFTYYFMLTGLHFIHYLGGIGILIYLLAGARPGADHRYKGFLESGGIYWHMVDLLWVFLFPMLYLQGVR